MVKYKLQVKRSKDKGTEQFFIYVPVFVAKQLNLKAGQDIDIELDGNRMIVRAL